MIKLEMLRVFVRVAEAGNIKDAADIIGRSPSAVSMTLKHLEESIGGRLFQTDRKDTLTELGNLVSDLAQEQIRSFDKSIGNIRDFAQSRVGSISIASVPSIAATALPFLIRQFSAERLHVDVELFDVDSSRVERMVKTANVDLGFGGEPRAGGAIKFTPLFLDRYKVLCSSTSSIGRLGTPVGWKDLQDQVLIRNGSSDKIESSMYFSLAKKSPLTVYNMMSLIAFVNFGHGITILPSLTTLNLPEGVRAIDFEGGKITRCIGMIERPDARPSPIAEAFRSFSLKNIPDFYSEIDAADILPLKAS